MGSTGLDSDLESAWSNLVKEAGSVRFLFCPNASVGIMLTLKAALAIGPLAAKNDFDVEIIETHHRRKIDQA